MSTAVILSNCYSVMERQKINEEWGDTFRNRLEPVWNECCKERFNYCYLQLDVDVPKIYRIGKDPIVEIDYMKFGEVLPDQIKKLNSHEENMNLPEINKK